MDEAFHSFPPEKKVKPPVFPPRPDLFDEVKWVPYASPDDAKLARQLWELPDSILGRATNPRGPFQRQITGNKAMNALAYNVYEHLMQQHMIPPSEDDWEQRWRDTMLCGRTWSLQEIFDPAKGLHAQHPDGPILVQGHNVLSAPYWTVAMLRAELRSRGLDDSGRSADLRRRLHDNERQSQGYPFLPRSNLSHWGFNRNNNFTFKLSETDALKPLDMYTWAIMLNPYNPAYWLSRAYCHYLQAFFDLAIGDAYRAQLLCEVLVNSNERNRQPGLYPRITNAIEQHILASPRDDGGNMRSETKVLREKNGIHSFVPTIRRALHNIISLSLSALGSWKDYDVMERYLKERVVFPDYRDTSAFERRQRVLEDAANDYTKDRNKERLFYHEKNAGNADGGKEYLYEANDKDRTTNVSLELINSNAFKDYTKCEVRASAEDDSLFVVATEDIEKGALIFAEEPSIRGHLRVTRLQEDQVLYESQQSRCENCRKLIDQDVLDQYSSELDEMDGGTHEEACECHLQSAGVPLHFCPADPQQGTTCMQIARGLYHNRVCGKNWKWLHDAMRAGTTPWNMFPHYPDIENRLMRQSEFFTHTNELHGTALSLLLREVFDITLLRREQTRDANLMAHEIDELAMLEDPKSWSNSWFPFTLAANIRVPFDILLQLGVDIFSDLTFDTWVIQTVLRKLIINAVPWDEKWRGPVERVKREGLEPHGKLPIIWQQEAMLEGRVSFDMFDPDFETLYLFSGFSLFNHACRGRHNADWGYDETIPNRVLVWAHEDIPKDTEIRIPYKFKPMSSMSARRILGKDCQCPRCRDGNADNEDDNDSDNEHYDNRDNYGDGNNSPDYAPRDDTSSYDTESIPSAESNLGRSSTSVRVLREGSSSNEQLNASSLLSDSYRPASPGRPRSSQISPITQPEQRAQNLQFVQSPSPKPQPSESSRSSDPSEPSQPSDSAQAMPPPPLPQPKAAQPQQPRPKRNGPRVKITPERHPERYRAFYGTDLPTSGPSRRSNNSSDSSTSTSADNVDSDGSKRSQDQDSDQGPDRHTPNYPDHYPDHVPDQDQSQDQDQNQNQDQDQDQDRGQDPSQNQTQSQASTPAPRRKRASEDPSLMDRFIKILRRSY